MLWYNDGLVPTTYPGPTGLSVPRCRHSQPSHKRWEDATILMQRFLGYHAVVVYAFPGRDNGAVLPTALHAVMAHIVSMFACIWNI